MSTTDTVEALRNVTIPPLPKPPALAEEPLGTTLRRIYIEKGHFRNVTEASLQEEIQNEADNDASSEKSEEEDREEVAKKDVEQFFKTRMEMINLVNLAWNSSQTVLDAVSMLLSKDQPQKATQSMSQWIRDHIPLGTFGYDLAANPKPAPPPKEQQARKEAAIAWRMKSLTSATNQLAEATDTLEKEAAKEARYWEQVLSVTEKGWSVRRANPDTNRHTLGVQYGSLEAGPQFRNRSFAPLETDEKGEVVLNRHLTRTPKATRVQIMKGNNIVGSSKVRPLINQEASIEMLIHRARDSIFDEELYHEMMLEARQLQSHNITVQKDAIQIPMLTGDPDGSSDAQEEILIDLVPLDDSGVLAETGTKDQFAEYIATSLRLLLSHTHRRRRLRRTQVPPPLTDEPRKPISSAIIGPLLNHLQHEHDMKLLRQYLDKTRTAFKAAGLSMDTNIFHAAQLELEEIETEETACGAPLEKLITLLTGPISVTATLSLPSSPEETLEIEIRTYFGAPDFGTTYTLHLTPLAHSLWRPAEAAKPLASSFKPLKFASVKELASFIDHILEMDIARNVVPAYNRGWSANLMEPQLAKQVSGKKFFISIGVEEGKLAFHLGQTMEKRSGRIWPGAEGTLKGVVMRLP